MVAWKQDICNHWKLIQRVWERNLGMDKSQNMCKPLSWKEYIEAGWQKLRERASGARRKVWTRTKILSPNIRYFVAILRFVAIYAFYKAFIEL